MREIRRRFVAVGVIATLTGCTATTNQNVSISPRSQVVVSDELKFGRGIPGGGTVSDSAWAVFLAEVVTPRFPDGFGFVRTEGQWRYADGTIGKEEGFTIEITHPLGTPPDSTFENIAKEYIRRFHQEAVFRSRKPAEMWMYRAPVPKQ